MIAEAMVIDRFIELEVEAVLMGNQLDAKSTIRNGFTMQFIYSQCAGAGGLSASELFGAEVQRTVWGVLLTNLLKLIS
jgi:hypothetical protein